MRIFRKHHEDEAVTMATATPTTITEAQALAAEVHTLRSALQKETEGAAKLREAYSAECRQLARGEDANVPAAKERLDLTQSRIEGIKIEIAEKQRALGELDRLEAEESRRRQVQQDFERASERLTATQAEIARLKAEYLAFPEKIRLAEWHFHEALRIFNLAKEANARVIAQ